MSALRAIERTLLALGLLLGGWCVAVLIQAERTSLMPVPAAHVLPGDADATGRPSAAAGAWIARLHAPSLHLTATVLEGSDAATLRRGAGHIEDTALPGATGNVGIAGHRDTIFRPLRRVRVGDAMELTTRDRVYHYRVVDTQVVAADAVSVLRPTPQPMLTLVTCYPFTFIGKAPKRFIVRAALVRDEPRPRAG